MICTTIQNKTLDEIFEILESGEVEMAEIRLDRCPDLSDEDIDSLFSGTDVPLLATCRVAGTPDDGADFFAAAKEAESRLSIAIEAGAAFVDLEMEAPPVMGKHIRRKAQECGATLIRSFHDFEGTPSSADLCETVQRAIQFGADIVKIVTTAHCAADVERTLSLYDAPMVLRPHDQMMAPLEEGRLIAFCMGEEGRASRMDCLAKGAPYTYAALEEGAQAAPGQWPFKEMRTALYGSRSAWKGGEVRMPASKSFAQRAIIGAALADGTSHLRGYSPCNDSEAAIAVARSLGAKVTLEDRVLEITGIGADGGNIASLSELHTGESGLLTRLMIPVIAKLRSEPTVVRGEKTLLKRPLTDANDIMAAFGVVLTNEEPHASKEVFVPLKVSGSLLPGRAEISGRGGSQLISGLLMALPLCDKPSTIYIDDPRSIPYMFITVDVLKQYGIRIANEMEGDAEFMETQDWAYCTGMTFKIKGGQTYKAVDFDIEGDWSSAAAFMVAAAVFGDVQVAGLDTHSLQADISIMDVLVQAGASVSQIENEPSDGTGIVNVSKAPLRAFSIDLNNAPDLFPVVSVLAAFCPGENRLAGVGRLAGKESDRATAIVDMLTQMGVECRTEGDEMVIMGHSLSWRLLNGALLKGGFFTSHHDHRMVMALKIAALGADSPVEIDDEKCVSKSFPDFRM